MGSEEIGMPRRAMGAKTRGFILEGPKDKKVRLQLEVLIKRGHFCSLCPGERHRGMDSAHNQLKFPANPLLEDEQEWKSAWV